MWGCVGFSGMLCLSPVHRRSGRTQGLFGNLPLCREQYAVALSPSWFVFCKASNVCLLSAFASLEQQSVLVLVTG